MAYTEVVHPLSVITVVARGELGKGRAETTEGSLLSENTVLVNGTNAGNKQKLFVENIDVILHEVKNLEKDQQSLKSKLNQVHNKLKV